jgi:GH18 family chitinase
LKYQSPDLKVLAAVGGYNEDLVEHWSAMAADYKTRDNFAINVLEFIRNNHLDGIGE